MSHPYTTSVPNWGETRWSPCCNWDISAPGIACFADAVDAMVYEFDGFEERILAWDADHARMCLGQVGLKELEEELKEAQARVHELEDELSEAEEDVDDLKRKIKNAKSAVYGRPTVGPDVNPTPSLFPV